MKLTISNCTKLKKLAEFHNLNINKASDFRLLRMFLFLPELPKDETLAKDYKGNLNFNLNSFCNKVN